MNKRIYNTNCFLEFTDESQLHQNQNIINAATLSNDDLTILLQTFINECKSDIYFQKNDFEVVWECLKSICKYIKAAGGFIQQDNKWLFIHRLNRWDLPKGKLEKGEIITDAAIRECEEECGIQNLKIESALPSTFHIYPHKGAYALKQTFWFQMSSDFKGELQPQVEEDIFEVKWFTKQEAELEVLENTYHTIRSVIEQTWYSD
jgi:8-oxo-dGTP pyrophosphatase MutT (NUDIX family)